MISMKAFLASAGALVAIGGLGTAGIATVSAQSTASGTHLSLADRIAQTFHLNSTDVQKVIDQQYQANQADREQAYESRLSQAVTNGKITAAQKDQILAKHKEVQSFMESLTDKTPTERHSAMKTEMDSVKTWAQQNNIPLHYLMPFGGHGHRGLMGAHMNMDGGNSTSPTTPPTSTD